MRADGRAYVLLDGASGVLILPVAAELPTQLLPGRRVVVAGDDAATWLVVGLTGASVLNVPHGLAQLDAAGDVPYTVLPSTVARLDAANVFTTQQAVQRDGAGTLFVGTVYGANPAYLIRRANGTVGVPTQVASGDTLLNFSARPWLHDTGVFAGSNAASFIIEAAQAITSTAMGTRMRFLTTQIGAATATERIRIADDGKVGIGVSVPHSRLQVAGSLATAYTALTANTTLDVVHSVVGVDTTAGNVMLTLPSATTCAGRDYAVKKLDASANTVTIAAAGAQTIDGAATYVLTAQWQVARLVAGGGNWLLV